MKKLHHLLGAVLILLFVNSTEQKDPAAILTPQEAIQDMQIESGFEVQAVLSEPRVEDPVQLTFDEDGRMWIVEMRGYMHDMDAAGEDLPLGRVKIFEDKNDDGEFEISSIFLDSLIMPRTVAVVKGGVLLVEPPNLLFIENKNGKAGKRTVIDPKFAEEGNVEHKANGLEYGIDNWLYNAKSDKRVRFINGAWKVEPTYFRGQWGISRDDFGRLYSNNNSTTLLADNFLPNSFGTNVNHVALSKETQDIRLVDNRVFPRRTTYGVNRGYLAGTLDAKGKLVNVTSAAGPVVYRGNNFPKEYLGNVFIAEPTAYLLKRLIIRDDGNNKLTGEFAYQDKEFLSGTDERFRPVSLYNSPDGAMIMIDFHRGVIQHKTYITPYLRNYADSIHLVSPIAMGRIYRIKWKQNVIGKNPHLAKASSAQLVKNLSHANGWTRDMSQRLLVDRNDKKVSKALKDLALTSENPITRIHALWTLEGMNEVTPEWLVTAGQKASTTYVYETVVKILSEFPTDKKALDALVSLRRKDNKMAEVQFANSVGAFNNTYWSATQPILLDLVTTYKDDAMIADAVLMKLEGKEKEFLASNNSLASSETVFTKALKADIDRIGKPRVAGGRGGGGGGFGGGGRGGAPPYLSQIEQQLFTQGAANYGRVCSTCHGRQGEGMKGLGLPLASSEWVNHANKKVPIKIVLDGLSGPLHVNNTLYAPPDYTAAMPAMRDSPDANDAAIAGMLTYIRNSFGNRAPAITATDVEIVRAETLGRKESYTEKELLEMK